MSEKSDPSVPSDATVSVSDSDRTRSIAAAAAAAGAADPTASPAVAAAETLAPGREFGTVRIRREIGRGAMGVVYLGHDRVLGRDVAVKALVNIGSAAGGEDASAAFLREARAAAAVKHANLTQIHHADVAPDATPFLVMEYVDGPSLARLLKQSGPIKPSVVLSVLADVCAAVEELHEREVVHRDLKPSNVLIDAEGQVYVTDFGLAVKRSGMSGGAAADALVAGTPLYMAPEMFAGQVSPRSDIYAIGIMAFEMLCGRVPFTGSLEEVRRKHAEEPLPVDELRQRGVSEELIDLIERATHKKAMFRHKTARELSRAVQQVGKSIPGTAAAKIELRRLVIRQGDPPQAETPLSIATPPTAANSTSYMEALSHIAAAKREKRMRLIDPAGAPVQGAAAAAAAVPVALSPVAATAPTDRGMDSDISCVQCGYNLRGLTRSGQCPECGNPVAASLSIERLIFSDEQWLRLVKAGVTTIAYAAAATALVFVFFQPLVWLVLRLARREATPGFGLAVVTRVFAPLLSSVFLAGAFAATLKEPGVSRGDQPTLLRWIVRCAAIVGCVLIAFIALLNASQSANFAGRARIAISLATFVSLGGVVLYLAWLADRVPDAKLARQSRRRGWFMIGGGLTLLGIEIIGSIKALGLIASTAAFLLPIFLAALSVLSAAMLWMTFRIRRVLAATLDKLVPAADAAAPAPENEE